MYKSTERNCQPEWMDDPAIDAVTLQNAVDEINKLNALLGGFKFTLNAVKKLIHKYPDKPLTIVDAGCGDGEMLRYLEKHLKSEQLTFIGLDLSAQSILKAREKSKGRSRISFVQHDILNLNAQSFSCDILTSTLTMHHFNDKEIVTFLKKFIEITSIALVINDLHRNRLAYMFFKFFSPIFIEHKIAKNDGLISIAAAFKRSDFKKYANAIGIKNDLVNWKWSFRFIWIIPANES